MLTYNEIANKQDREFQARAKSLLGKKRYMELAKVAKRAFKEAYEKEENEVRKPGAAKRAANMVFTKALKVH